MNMPLVLLNRRRRGFTAFSPSTLFSTTAIGIWLDPSDLTTMFSDRAGTTAVTTPGTVVGLRLDKSKGLVLGPELSNQDLTTYADYGPLPFDTRTATATSLTLATATNKLAIAASPDTIAVVSGRSYRVSYTVAVVSGGVDISIRSDVASTSYFSTGTISTSGTRSFVFAATVTENVVFQITNFSGVGNYTFSNISVRELAGNHATAPTDAARPTYGIEPKGGRRNLLEQTETFDNAYWSKAGLSVLQNVVTAPDGTNTADKLVEDAASNQHAITRTVTSTGVTTYTLSLSAKAAERAWVGLFLTHDFTNSAYCAFDLSSGSANTPTVAGASVASSFIEAQGNGWYRCTLTITTAGFTNPYAYVQPLTASATSRQTYAGDGTSGIYIWGAQLEAGAALTNYQRVTTAYDVTESGVVSCHYVQYDGSDDSLSTSAIDFTGTDKMSVFAGVRKLSDAAVGVIAELSPTVDSNNGSFALGTGSATYNITNKGTTARSATSPANYAAPVSNVLTTAGDISGDIVNLRINGVQAAQTTTDQGTGNYGNYSLYLGRRNNGATAPNYPLFGRDYGIIVVGKAASAGEITDTETWLAAKTSGVTI